MLYAALHMIRALASDTSLSNLEINGIGGDCVWNTAEVVMRDAKINIVRDAILLVSFTIPILEQTKSYSAAKIAYIACKSILVDVRKKISSIIANDPDKLIGSVSDLPHLDMEARIEIIECLLSYEEHQLV